MKNSFLISALIILSAIGLAGCGKSAVKEAPAAPEEMSLTSEVFITDSLLDKPIAMTVTDRDFIIVNSYNNDTLISVFTLDGSHVTN